MYVVVDDLPVGNLLTYFVPFPGSAPVQKEFAKPIQHGKCPRAFREELNVNSKASRQIDTYPVYDSPPCSS